MRVHQRLFLVVWCALTATLGVPLAMAIYEESSWPANYHPAPCSSSFDSCDDPLRSCAGPGPCVIRNNWGGYTAHFLYAAVTLPRRVPRGAVIDGACFSGCAIFAAWGRPHVCLTRRAVLGFHKSDHEDDPPYPEDVRSWIAAHGGAPSFRSGRLLFMVHEESQRFFRTCSSLHGGERPIWGPPGSSLVER